MSGLKNYLYASKLFSNKKFMDGILYLKKSSEEGYPLADIWLHYFYWHGYYTLLNVHDPNIIRHEIEKLTNAIQEKAVDWIKINITTKSTHLLYGLGYLYYQGIGVPQDYNMALKCYLLKPKSQHVYTHHIVAESLLKLGNIKDARKKLGSILHNKCVQGPILYSLGLIHHVKKRYDKALIFFRKTAQLEPHFLNAQYYWADTLYRCHRHLEACFKINQVLEEDESNPIYWILKGKVEYALKKYSMAIFCFEKAESIDNHIEVISKHRQKSIQRMEVQCQQTYKISAAQFKLKNMCSKNHTFDIRDYSYNSLFIKQLFNKIVHSPNTLRNLHLNQVTDIDLISLLEVLKVNTHLTNATYNPRLLTKSSMPIQNLLQIYILRNRLLSMEKITSTDINHLNIGLLPSIELRNMLQLILNKHRYLKKFDFSNKGLTANSSLLEPKNLPCYPSLTHLDLSHNQISNEGVKKLCLLLKTIPAIFPNLTSLNLANNKIGDIGIEAIVNLISSKIEDNLTCSIKKLSLINLDDNFITSAASLNDIAHNYAQRTLLGVSVSLSNNMLWKGEKKEKGLNVSESGFFVSYPRSVKSLIDPNCKYPINTSHGLVFIARTKSYNPFDHHIMLYLEGMESSGQHYIIRYHILSPEQRVAYVKIEERDFVKLTKDFNKFEFIRTYRVSAQQAEKLHQNISQQKDTTFQFSKFSKLDGPTQNCLMWSLSHLKKIGIREPPPGLGIPCFMAAEEEKIHRIQNA